jgi:hypothetical protein
MPTWIPAIAEFPSDGRRWRLDWLGDVNLSPSVYSEPTIAVALSPVRDGIQNPATTSGVLDQEQRIVRIGIGQMPYLRVGSIWQGQRQLEEIAGETLSLKDICISPGTVKLIAVGSEIGIKRRVIPPYLYSLKGGLAAKCFAIHYNGDPHGIILPTAEAIRFYYAASTDLAHIAFLGMYQHELDKIINPKLSGFAESETRCYLRVRRWLADEDGWTIGRVLHDPFAAQGIRRLSDSLVRDTANRQLSFPECDLPFQGTVRWKARGLPIRVDGKPDRFLIFELLRCSSPFPFEELEVTRDNDGRKAPPETDIPKAEKRPDWALGRSVIASENGGILQSEHEPEGGVTRVQLPLANECFEALSGKKIIRNPKEECQYTAEQFRPLYVLSGNILATSHGNSKHYGVLPAEIVTHRGRRLSLPASLDTIISAVPILNSFKGISAKVRPYCEEEIPTILPPEKAQFAYLDFKKKIRRRLIAVNIETGGKHFCLIDFERPPNQKRAAGLALCADGMFINGGLFHQMLLVLARNRGSWDKVSNHRPLGIKCIRIYHSWDEDVEACAKAVASKIRQHFHSSY